MVREFDLAERAFVADGFTLPEAKSGVGWIDADHIYVGTDFGPGSLTDSGYPRVVKRWRRGTPLAEAEVVFEGRDRRRLGVRLARPDPGLRARLRRPQARLLPHREFLLTRAGELVRIDVPDDAETDVHREWLLIRLRSPWTVGAVTYPAGTLLVTRFDDFLAGGRELTPCSSSPTRAPRCSYHAWTRNHLILALLDDVRRRLEVLTPARPGLAAGRCRAPEFDHVEIVGTNPDHSDEYLLASSGFLQPATLRSGGSAPR